MRFNLNGLVVAAISLIFFNFASNPAVAAPLTEQNLQCSSHTANIGLTLRGQKGLVILNSIGGDFICNGTVNPRDGKVRCIVNEKDPANSGLDLENFTLILRQNGDDTITFDNTDSGLFHVHCTQR